MKSETIKKPFEAIPQAITGFHLDEAGDWVAELACGHNQHVRHNPPWVSRPWVGSAEGRAAYLGRRLNCRACVTDAAAATEPKPTGPGE